MFQDDYIEIKAILVGCSGVGKTNLINVCLGHKFNEGSDTTNCCSLSQKNVEIDNIKYLINLWDTMGQETYKGISKLFFRGSQIVIFVYDITSENSFKDLEDWINMANEIITDGYVSGIVGNKNDLFLQAEVAEEDAKQFAKSKNMKFKLVSAKEDPKSFNDFLVDLVREYKLPDKKEKTVLKKKSTHQKKSFC